MEAHLQDGGLEESLTPAAPGATDVDTLLAKFPGPVRLYAVKTYLRLAFGAAAVIEFLLVKNAIAGDGPKPAGWVILGFFTLVFLITGYAMLARHVFALTLDGAGFTVNFIFRSRHCAWQDVSDFSLWQNRHFQAATYNDRTLAQDPLQRLLCKYRRARYDRDTALPDPYSLGAEAMVLLMRQWRQRALAQQA